MNCPRCEGTDIVWLGEYTSQCEECGYIDEDNEFEGDDE